MTKTTKKKMPHEPHSYRYILVFFILFTSKHSPHCISFRHQRHVQVSHSHIQWKANSCSYTFFFIRFRNTYNDKSNHNEENIMRIKCSQFSVVVQKLEICIALLSDHHPLVSCTTTHGKKTRVQFYVTKIMRLAIIGNETSLCLNKLPIWRADNMTNQTLPLTWHTRIQAFQSM